MTKIYENTFFVLKESTEIIKRDKEFMGELKEYKVEYKKIHLKSMNLDKMDLSDFLCDDDLDQFDIEKKDIIQYIIDFDGVVFEKIQDIHSEILRYLTSSTSEFLVEIDPLDFVRNLKLQNNKKSNSLYIYELLEGVRKINKKVEEFAIKKLEGIS